MIFICYHQLAYPEDKALLESNPSAEVGDDGGAEAFASVLLFSAPFDSPNAVNSGGLGAEPPCAIESIHDSPFCGSSAPDRNMI